MFTSLLILLLGHISAPLSLIFKTIRNRKSMDFNPISFNNLTYIVTVGTGKQLVAIYNVSFGRQILNWTVRDGHYIWRPTVSLYQLLLCKSRYSVSVYCFSRTEVYQRWICKYWTILATMSQATISCLMKLMLGGKQELKCWRTCSNLNVGRIWWKCKEMELNFLKLELMNMRLMIPG